MCVEYLVMLIPRETLDLQDCVSRNATSLIWMGQGQNEGRTLNVWDLTGQDDLVTNMYYSPKMYYSSKRENNNPESYMRQLG